MKESSLFINLIHMHDIATNYIFENVSMLPSLNIVNKQSWKRIPKSSKRRLYIVPIEMKVVILSCLALARYSKNLLNQQIFHFECDKILTFNESTTGTSLAL